MLLRRIPIPDYPFKPKPVRRRYVEFDPGAHDTQSHGSAAQGIPKMDSSVRRYPLAIENFQPSKADETNAIEYRKPWVDKLMALTQAVLCLALVGIALAMGYRHFSGF